MNVKQNTLNNSELDLSMRTIAKSSQMLLFYQFSCPHCGTVNVYAKNYKKEIVLCSETGCKKMIIIDNYKEIA
jgi:transcription elongation factor Elf1